MLISFMNHSPPYSHDSNSRNKMKKRAQTQASLVPCMKPRKPTTAAAALLELKHLDVSLTSPGSDSPVNSIRIQPDRRYTIGRSRRRCDFVFADRRVGSRHCQVFYDSFDRKLCIVDGDSVSVAQFRSESRVRASLNGVYVNGIRIRGGEAVELTEGDQVSLACSTVDSCSDPVRIGFVIHKIDFEEMYVSNNSQGSVIVSNPKAINGVVTPCWQHARHIRCGKDGIVGLMVFLIILSFRALASYSYTVLH